MKWNIQWTYGWLWMTPGGSPKKFQETSGRVYSWMCLVYLCVLFQSPKLDAACSDSWRYPFTWLTKRKWPRFQQHHSFPEGLTMSWIWWKTSINKIWIKIDEFENIIDNLTFSSSISIVDHIFFLIIFGFFFPKWPGPPKRPEEKEFRALRGPGLVLFPGTLWQVLSRKFRQDTYGTYGFV